MMSLANHYSCYVLTYAVKAKTEGTQEVIVYRRVNGKIFACPITVQMFFNEGEEKPVIAIRLRTVIPEYVSLANRKQSRSTTFHQKLILNTTVIVGLCPAWIV